LFSIGVGTKPTLFFVMIYLITDGLNYKIGYSQNPLKRLQQLQTAQSKKLKLIAIFEGDKRKEKQIHYILRQFHRQGEWFNFRDNNISDIIDIITNFTELLYEQI